MRIRRHMRGLAFLSLCVALLFVIRELPELASLADDVSNDGEVIELVVCDASSDEASERDHGESAGQATSTQGVPRFWTCQFSRILPLRPGKNLLQFLSLLRV
jgi:hypothetical protein